MGSSKHKRRREEDDVAEDVCLVCAATTLTPTGKGMKNVLLCDGCDGEVHLSCSSLSAMPREKEAYHCATCDEEEDEDVCDVCGEATMTKKGEPCKNVLICEDCDCEVHLRCSSLKAMPAEDESYHCERCGPLEAASEEDDDDVCKVCREATVTKKGEPCKKVLICEQCDCEVHLRCTALKKMPNDDEPWHCEACRPTGSSDVEVPTSSSSSVSDDKESEEDVVVCEDCDVKFRRAAHDNEEKKEPHRCEGCRGFVAKVLEMLAEDARLRRQLLLGSLTILETCVALATRLGCDVDILDTTAHHPLILEAMLQAADDLSASTEAVIA